MESLSDELTQLHLLTADELARVLRVGRTTVYRWAKEGRLPSVKIGKTVRFNRLEIEKIIHGDGLPEKTG